MDAVVLAAGKGERLDGLVPAYHKPLILVNGKPLIAQCVANAIEAGAARVVVVVAPSNAAAICQVVRFPGVVRFIVQVDAKGPGDALLLALELCRSGEILVQMGDNLSTAKDVALVANSESPFAIGVQEVDASQAERLTWRETATGKWREKDKVVGGHRVKAWLGPFKAPYGEITAAYRTYGATKGELPIGPVFNLFSSPDLVEVTTVDIGVPESL